MIDLTFIADLLRQLSTGLQGLIGGIFQPLIDLFSNPLF